MFNTILIFIAHRRRPITDVSLYKYYIVSVIWHPCYTRSSAVADRPPRDVSNLENFADSRSLKVIRNDTLE